MYPRFKIEKVNLQMQEDLDLLLQKESVEEFLKRYAYLILRIFSV